MSDKFSPERQQESIEHCQYCPKLCRHACPVSETTGKEFLTPREKMIRLGQLKDGQDVSSLPIWACTGCRHCTKYCDHGIEPGFSLFAGRALTHESSDTPLANYPNRFQNREDRLVKALSEISPPDSGNEIGYWPGCDMIDKHPEALKQTLSILASVSEKNVSLIQGGQACAGYPLLAGGYINEFRWHATKVARTLRQYRTIVVDCSACTFALRKQYAAEGIEFTAQVQTVPEFLETRLQDTTAKETTVYYHDPCYLARYEQVFDAPRAILGRLADVREFVWNKDDTQCCGGAGLLPKTQSSVADTMAKTRLSEVAAAGGGIVVTSCGTCSFQLKRNAPDSVTVLPIGEAIAMLTGRCTPETKL